jgi:hypothetical protein
MGGAQRYPSRVTMLRWRHDRLSPQLHCRGQFLLHRQSGGAAATVVDGTHRRAAERVSRDAPASSVHDRCDGRAARSPPHDLDPAGGRISQSRAAKGERGIWQRRYWEHTIRDETDFNRHVDYIHINPVKHRLVARVRDWPYSSFHRMVKHGVYPEDWAGDASHDGGVFGERQ